MQNVDRDAAAARLRIRMFGLVVAEGGTFVFSVPDVLVVPE